MMAQEKTNCYVCDSLYLCLCDFLLFMCHLKIHSSNCHEHDSVASCFAQVLFSMNAQKTQTIGPHYCISFEQLQALCSGFDEPTVCALNHSRQLHCADRMNGWK